MNLRRGLRSCCASDDRIRVLIAGGGVAALETMLAPRTLAPELVRTELLAPEHHFWYRPLAVAEPFDAGRAHHFELAQLAEEAGATYTRARWPPSMPIAKLRERLRAQRCRTTSS